MYVSIVRWIMVAGLAALLSVPSGVFAEDGRARGRGSDDAAQVGSRDQSDDVVAEPGDDRGGDRALEPGDDRGADDGVAAPAATVAAAAPSAPVTQTGGVAVNVVDGSSASSWTYTPAQVTTIVGTRLTWTNTGAEAHTVTSDDRTTFDSRNMAPGATFSCTPTTPGTFAYHCAYHPFMTATLTVTQ
ncbi:MAG TPA: cupredoxin domain-containing protein [Chloroflexota bacterium]|nr:cupredoxin domain-containing protein [Chloroflexota bacterium]